MELSDFEKIDIKENPLEEKAIDDLAQKTGSYEALFSKRAQLYKQLGLKEKNLSEKDYKNYLMQHYTFLKRPVILDNDKIFVGSSPKIKKELEEKYGK